MKKNIFILFIGVLWMWGSAVAQQYVSPIRTEVVQMGQTTIEVVWIGDKAGSVKVKNGKREYEVGRGRFSDMKLEGSISFPKGNSPEDEKLKQKAGLEQKDYSNKVIGLRADFIQYIPDLGLIGIKLPEGSKEKEQYKKGEIEIAQGVVIWQVDLATGAVKVQDSDEAIVYAPYSKVFSKRLLYIKKGPINGSAEKSGQMHGYFYEGNQLVKAWENLSVMAPPRSLGFGKPDVPRYYRYLDGYVQLAEQKMGDAYEVAVFDNQLQEKISYFPALLVYRNWEKMPDSKTFGQGKKLVADYRSGTGLGADKLFQRQVLVPSNELEGLYGVLQADGTVDIPEGSLGLSPIITEEKNAASKTGETYLLNHFFLVAYPGAEEGKMHYGVAGPDGKLSFGSAENPVWTEFMVYESEIIKENNSSIYVHPELLVARLPDGNWHCYLASRYRGYAYDGRYESLGFYFPTPYGSSSKTPHEAIASVEPLLVALNDTTEKRVTEARAKYLAQLRIEGENRMRENQRKLDEWAAANPSPAPRRGGVFQKSTWQGFTYSSETTRRFNQSVNQSNYNNSMRQYNNYLNSRIYRNY
ncbi:hypothetical protein E4S40_06105 [Algoriphagus kandeliae]|uniref:WG repeat-containing protein n=1 Tax=Algoriphagus kandeliae TaxID=2562278 RepID=A0A4Y9QX25_9BACT|nr:hypothetical protein [Algoriphagus kandeliae]TFV95793.1 hypothetical protein E4S40_06105 [Algoriphagus kandeliae]